MRVRVCLWQILMPFVIFGGLLINLNEIPAYFVWYSIFSFVQYGEGRQRASRASPLQRTRARASVVYQYFKYIPGSSHVIPRLFA